MECRLRRRERSDLGTIVLLAIRRNLPCDALVSRIFNNGVLDHEGWGILSSCLILILEHIDADLKLNSGDDHAVLTSRDLQV
jgi:hypothetical protein